MRSVGGSKWADMLRIEVKYRDTTVVAREGTIYNTIAAWVV